MYKVISCLSMVLFHVSIAQDSSALYSYYDPKAFQLLLCDKCPPGTYVKHDCTAEKKTECVPCPANHYTDIWNSNKECYYCSAVCKELQYVTQECNGTHSRACECIGGRYLELEFCLLHTACPPGFGVVKSGTPESDTACEKCSEGTFSNETSTKAVCQRHTDCKKLGLNVLEKGNAEHDTVCQHNTDESSPFCDIDVTLCEEALFWFSLDLPVNWFTVLMHSLVGKIITTDQIDWPKSHNPQEQHFQLFKLWKQQTQDHTVKNVIKGLQVCEKGVLKHVGHLNMTIDHLTALMESLPGKKIGKHHIERTARRCDESKQILKLLSLWRNKNGRDTVKNLKLLKSNKLPKILRRRLKKMVRFLHSGAMFKLYQKLLLEINGTQMAKLG
ncbi:tumor necrosis factor receptor superfamily member 11B [Bombina bombina]|uniref:tumor necrosis factor receptor superfamily member 11B n=1 Tax=Bombina bombina TaxID=8345 RepID=UPI00235AD58D|nr:tumor necrosis factor receptor superfamily member 11B [Bombina bombina]